MEAQGALLIFQGTVGLMTEMAMEEHGFFCFVYQFCVDFLKEQATTSSPL